MRRRFAGLRAAAGATLAAITLAGCTALAHSSSTLAPPRESPAPPSRLLTAPFAAPRASYFHAALLVPPLASAATLDPGSVLVRGRTSHTDSQSARAVAGIQNRFKGEFHEWLALEVAWGAARSLELSGRTAIAGWDEHDDRFSLFDSNGTPIVRDEAGVIFGTAASRRHENLSAVTLGAKQGLLAADRSGFDLALAAALKIPVARGGDLTNAGSWDVAATALASLPCSWGELHLNAGVVAPLGGQNLFEPGEAIDLQPFAHGGAGVTVTLARRLALGVQLEANGSAFRDVPFLADPPLGVVAGLRWLDPAMVVELGGGLGLDRDSTYGWLLFASFGWLF